LVATDVNPAMLEAARTNLDGDGAHEYRTADGAELPFDDDSFDAVVCQWCDVLSLKVGRLRRGGEGVAMAFIHGSPLATQLNETGMAEQAFVEGENALIETFGAGEVRALMQAIEFSARLD